MMRSDTLLIVDIEAVKDKRVLGEWPEDRWPPPVGWRVVAIGMLVARYNKTNLGLTVSVERSGCLTGPEDRIISKFWSFFDRREPVLVTWNGRGYDLPILRQRALIHGIAAPRWFQSDSRCKGYSYRYATDWHCDLMDHLSDYGACARTGMDLMARAMGLPGKIGGDGAEVEAMFEAGELGSIANYCECDVLNLYGIYLRWLMVVGRTSRSSDEQNEMQFVEFLRTSEKIHHTEFLAKWDRASTPRCPSLLN